MTSLLLAHAQVASEEPVFNAVIQWVKHGDAARVEHLAPLLRHVRLPLLSAKYITDVVDDEVRTLQLMTSCRIPSHYAATTYRSQEKPYVF